MTHTTRPLLFLSTLLLLAGCSGGGSLAGDRVMVSAEESSGGYYEGGEAESVEPATSAPAAYDGSAVRTPEPRPEERAGLATQWGETRQSRVSMTRFVRASGSPLALTSLHYNDANGAVVQAALRNGTRPVEFVSLHDPMHGHRVHVSLRDEAGNAMPAYNVGDRVYVVGQAGRRYSIQVENRTPYRLEAVVSVDGLDVVRGTEASLEHRGYVLQPWGTITIDGFRQSTEQVAAFRFGSVASSYAAQTTGSARNVGVVGVALFGEAGAALPPSLLAEAELRERANPFPGQFAAPPPVHYAQ